MNPKLVALTKRALNRTHNIQEMRWTLRIAVDIDQAIEAIGSPDKKAFMDIARSRGMREAIAWRDARFARGREGQNMNHRRVAAIELCEHHMRPGPTSRPTDRAICGAADQ